MKLGSYFSLFLLSIVFCLVAVNAQAGINVGDILVVDNSSGVNPQGLVFVINPNNGQRTVVTDLGNPGQGPTGDDPRDLVMEPDGNIYVIDSEGGTDDIGVIFHVDVATGLREILSDLGNPAQGPIGDLPQGLGLFSNGDLYFADRDAPNEDGGLFRVNKANGFRTLVTDLTNPGQGPLGEFAHDVAEGPGGVIYLLTSQGGTNGDGLLFEVDPVTGFRTVISDFGNLGQGPDANPRWLVVAPIPNTVYILNPSNINNAVFVVDTLTGNRQILSDFDNPGQGPTETNVQGIAVDSTGQILVNGNNTDVLFSIDPNTGNRTIITEYDNPGQGALGSFGSGIIIATVATDIIVPAVPTLSEWGLIAMASILGIVGFMVARRRKITL